MAAQAGKDILLKISDGAPTPVFTTVAGLRARTISLNAQAIDATDGDSTGRWRELLAGAGVRSVAVSGSGVFRDAASDAAVRDSFFAQTARIWRLVIPDFVQLEGPFLVSATELLAILRALLEGGGEDSAMLDAAPVSIPEAVAAVAAALAACA